MAATQRGGGKARHGPSDPWKRNTINRVPAKQLLSSWAEDDRGGGVFKQHLSLTLLFTI